MKIEVDESRWPLLVTTFPADFGAGEAAAYFDHMRAVHAREERFAHISDLSALGSSMNPVLRRHAAEFMTAEGDRSARLCVGAAQVAPSRLVRGALTAIFWIAPPRFPSCVVATLKEARTWCDVQLQKSGLA